MVKRESDTGEQHSQILNTNNWKRDTQTQSKTGGYSRRSEREIDVCFIDKHTYLMRTSQYW